MKIEFQCMDYNTWKGCSFLYFYAWLERWCHF